MNVKLFKTMLLTTSGPLFSNFVKMYPKLALTYSTEFTLKMYLETGSLQIDCENRYPQTVTWVNGSESNKVHLN